MATKTVPAAGGTLSAVPLAPNLAERPPLTPAHTDRLTQALDKAYAITMLLSVVDDGIGHADDAALAVLDYLDEARAELAKLTEASHG